MPSLLCVGAPLGQVIYSKHVLVIEINVPLIKLSSKAAELIMLPFAFGPGSPHLHQTHVRVTHTPKTEGVVRLQFVCLHTPTFRGIVFLFSFTFMSNENQGEGHCDKEGISKRSITSGSCFVLQMKEQRNAK